MDSLEKLIKQAGIDLANEQVARLFKVPESMEQTPCDFFGYTKTGRAILVEAKRVKAASLKIGGKPGMQPHQWAELDDANRANAIALIAWQNGDAIAVFSMDQAIAWSAGRKSISWRSIPDDYKDVGVHDLLYHWITR